MRLLPKFITRSSTKPLVVLAQPPVLPQPREGALHHPTPRQSHVPPRRHQLLPVDLLALLGPIPCPNLGNILVYLLRRLPHRPKLLPYTTLGPSPTPSLVS